MHSEAKSPHFESSALSLAFNVLLPGPAYRTVAFSQQDMLGLAMARCSVVNITRI